MFVPVGDMVPYHTGSSGWGLLRPAGVAAATELAGG